MVLGATLHQAAFHAANVLAAATTAPSTGTNDDGGESKKSGPIGLVVIIVLCVACYFLFKSMSKHMKRIREDFPGRLPTDPPPVEAPAAAADTTSVDLVKPPEASVRTDPPPS